MKTEGGKSPDMVISEIAEQLDGWEVVDEDIPEGAIFTDGFTVAIRNPEVNKRLLLYVEDIVESESEDDYNYGLVMVSETERVGEEQKPKVLDTVKEVWEESVVNVSVGLCTVHSNQDVN